VRYQCLIAHKWCKLHIVSIYTTYFRDTAADNTPIDRTDNRQTGDKVRKTDNMDSMHNKDNAHNIADTTHSINTSILLVRQIKLTMHSIWAG
jgi:hypothetical protein